MSGVNVDIVAGQSAEGEVLIVGDEEYVRGILATMLGSMGLESVEAINGTRAWQRSEILVIGSSPV